MLVHFSAKNFKQFDSVELDFTNVREYCFNTENLTENKKLLKTMLIYGENASGKSNFGFALFDIVNHLTDKQKFPRGYQSYLNADNHEKPAEFSYTFLFNERKITYQYKKTDAVTLISESLIVDDDIIFSWDSLKEEDNFKNLENFGLDTLNNVFWGKKNRTSFLRYAANNALDLEKSSLIIKIVEFVGAMLWFRRADDANNFIGLLQFPENIEKYIISEDMVSRFQEFLHVNGVNEDLVVMQRPDGVKGIYFKHKQLLPVFEQFGVASSGTYALSIQFYWMNFFKDARFVFIDEFDAFYHHEVAENIFRELQKLPIQSIVTTHNTGLLNNRLTRPDCCLVIQKGKLMSFADRTNREIREGNNLEKLYKAGEFND